MQRARAGCCQSAMRSLMKKRPLRRPTEPVDAVRRRESRRTAAMCHEDCNHSIDYGSSRHPTAAGAATRANMRGGVGRMYATRTERGCGARGLAKIKLSTGSRTPTLPADLPRGRSVSKAKNPQLGFSTFAGIQRTALSSSTSKQLKNTLKHFEAPVFVHTNELDSAQSPPPAPRF